MADVTTLSTIDALLNVIKKKTVIDQFRNTRPLLDMLKRKVGKEGVGTAGGRSVEVPMRLSPNHAFAGVIGESGEMAPGGTGTYTTVNAPVYPINATGNLGHIGELKSKSSLQSLASLLERVTKDTSEGLMLNLNKVCWGYGTGIAGRINGAITANTFTITIDQELTSGAGGTFGTLHMRPGQWLQATSDASLTHPNRIGLAQIATVNSATEITVENASISTWADNDYLCWKDCLNNISEGIFSVNEGYKTTYRGKNRSQAANAFFKTTRVTSVGTGDVEESFIQGILQIQKDIGGYPKVGFTGSTILKEIYKDSVVGDRRWVNPDGKRKYALGFEAISLVAPGGASIELFVEPDIPGDIVAGNEGIIVCIDPEDWNFWSAGTAEPDWYKSVGGSQVHQVSGSYGLFVNMLWVFNLLCDMPKRQLFLEDIDNS